MPHSVEDMDPNLTLQAVILCGPGVSFTTFASNPEDFPKALIPIANRPMVWYALDLCNRMGIDDVTLIVPVSSEASMSRALETNVHLRSLPKSPRLLAPEGLEQTTGTASIFRLPAVKKCIVSDFVVLPCDIICELDGLTILRTWMAHQSWSPATDQPRESKDKAIGENRGGFTMWYDTKGENSIKGEETDFMMTTQFRRPPKPNRGATLSSTSKLVYSMPTDTLNDTTAENQGALPLRPGLLRKYPRARMFTQHRDAHFYIFPSWIIGMIDTNEHMLSLAEDVLGWWAKAEWQVGLGDKLGLRGIFEGLSSPKVDAVDDGTIVLLPVGYTGEDWRNDQNQAVSNSLKAKEDSFENAKKNAKANGPLVVPPIIAYVHPSYEGNPLVRRVDTAPLLLSISLRMAKLGSVEEVGRSAASPFAHQTKIASGAEIAWGKCTVTKGDSLIGHKVKVEEKCSVKESVIGANSHLHSGAKLLRCLLMDGVVVGKGCRLTNCIIGRNAEIGPYSTLIDCEVQDNHKVEAETEETGEKIMSSRGLEEVEESDGSDIDDSKHLESADEAIHSGKESDD